MFSAYFRLLAIVKCVAAKLSCCSRSSCHFNCLFAGAVPVVIRDELIINIQSTYSRCP